MRRDAHEACDLTAQVAGLDTLDRTDLVIRWSEIFGKKPPAKISRELMIAGIAWQIQVHAIGGFSEAALRRLGQLGRDLKAGRSVDPTSAIRIKPGTKLIREWNGTNHEVLVLDNGFAWRGERYASLSEIAREITGTRWSGPRFFGLKNQLGKEKRSSHAPA